MNDTTRAAIATPNRERSEIPTTEDLDEFAIRFIRAKVRKLIGRAGFTESDREDLYQDFALDLIKRRRKFDPATGTWEAFVVVVVSNFFVSVLKHRRAQMRSHELEAKINSEQKVFEATIAESQDARRTGQYRSRQEASELTQDVATVLYQMPPRKRAICELLKHESKASVARTLQISRDTLYEEVGRIRTQFEKASLNEYEL